MEEPHPFLIALVAEARVAACKLLRLPAHAALRRVYKERRSPAAARSAATFAKKERECPNTIKTVLEDKPKAMADAFDGIIFEEGNVPVMQEIDNALAELPIR